MRAHRIVHILVGLALAVAAPAAWAQAEAPESVVAVVNDEQITRQALLDRLLNLTNIGQMVLDEMIGEALLRQEAKRLNVSVTDEEIEGRIADVKARLEGSEERFQQYMRRENVTTAGLVHKVRMNIMAEKVLGDEVKVTDDQMEQGYQASKGRYDQPERVMLRWIRVKTEAEAQAAWERLEKKEAFEKVAQEVTSDERTRQKGGMVGWVSKEQLPLDLREPAFATGVDSYTKPIKTSMGDYAILKVQAKVAAVPHDPAQVRIQIRASLETYRLREAAVKLMTQLREAASIENKLAPSAK